jgi:hypothetical protein
MLCEMFRRIIGSRKCTIPKAAGPEKKGGQS